MLINKSEINAIGHTDDGYEACGLIAMPLRHTYTGSVADAVTHRVDAS